MPKRDSTRKRPDFLRFRPLHAFTTPADQAKLNGRKVLTNILWIVGFVALMFIAAILFLRGR